MKCSISHFLTCTAFLVFVATAVAGEKESDLNDPATLKKILGTALEWETLKKDELTGLYHAPDTQKPYTGWTKGLNGHGRVALGGFKEGKPDGPSIVWHKNGQKSEEGTFKDGKPEGIVTQWHENGKMAGCVIYKDGKQEGPYTKWHENGTKGVEGQYKDGKPDGLWTWWDENGNKEDEKRYTPNINIVKPK